MNIAIIGRSEIMYETINLCLEQGFKIPIIITSKETPEYKRSISDFEIISKNIDEENFICYNCFVLFVKVMKHPVSRKHP